MKINNSDSYKYLRLTHVIAICFGLPYTRRKIKDGIDPKNENVGHLAGRYTITSMIQVTIYIVP